MATKARRVPDEHFDDQRASTLVVQALGARDAIAATPTR
jgi:hypothetical protein